MCHKGVHIDKSDSIAILAIRKVHFHTKLTLPK